MLMPRTRTQMVGLLYIMLLRKGMFLSHKSFRLTCALRHLEIARLLVEVGNANVNSQSRSTGYTPLSSTPFAREHG
jgi:hypothetical protein